MARSVETREALATGARDEREGRAGARLQIVPTGSSFLYKAVPLIVQSPPFQGEYNAFPAAQSHQLHNFHKTFLRNRKAQLAPLACVPRGGG